MLDSPSRKVDAVTTQNADREMSEALSENGLRTGGVSIALYYYQPLGGKWNFKLHSMGEG